MNFLPSTGTTTVQVNAGGTQTPTMAITLSTSSIDSNAGFNVTVTVGEGTTIPQGTVTITAGSFSDDLDETGGGIYRVAIPANSLTGTVSGQVDTVTAYYSGDTNYAFASVTANITVSQSTFGLSATSITNLAPGAVIGNTSTVLVSALNGYTGTVTLTCQEETDNSPTTGDGATCTIPSTTVTMGGTVTATVTTTAPVTAALAYPKVRGNGRGWEGAGGGAVLALLFFFGIPSRRRKWRSMLGMLVLMMALGSMAACGGGGSNNGGGGGGGGGTTPPPTADPGTAAGTYTFTVVATGNPSVTPAVQTRFMVTVN